MPPLAVNLTPVTYQHLSFVLYTDVTHDTLCVACVGECRRDSVRCVSVGVTACVGCVSLALRACVYLPPPCANRSQYTPRRRYVYAMV